jgi:beta-1,4-mannosyltransferase
MRIAFCPFVKSNPYQRRLAEELEQCGATVEPLCPPELLLRGCLATRKLQVLHIHWTDRLLLGKTWWESAARSIVCIAQLSLCRLFGRRIVWTAHNLGSHEQRCPRTERFFTSLLARIAHRVIVHTNAAAALVAQTWHVAESKIRVIPHAHYIDDYPNTVDPAAARASLGIQPGAIVFLFLGRVRLYKGVGELIDAFRALDQPDARLVIAGRPLNEQVDRQMRARIGGDARIDYRPKFVEAHEMEIYFNAADVVALPFSDVLTSGSLLLAMSFAKPCLIPAAATLTETVPVEGAVRYDPHETGALAAALRRAVELRHKLPEMGQANYRAVRAWGWPEMARATYQAYCD